VCAVGLPTVQLGDWSVGGPLTDCRWPRWVVWWRTFSWDWPGIWTASGRPTTTWHWWRWTASGRPGPPFSPFASWLPTPTTTRRPSTIPSTSSKFARTWHQVSQIRVAFAAVATGGVDMS